MIRNKSMKRATLASAIVATSAMVLSIVPAQANSTGVTATSIKLGVSTPLTGSAGLVYGKVPGAMRAYFDYINANGGVNGRKISLVIRDDKYLPTLAATQTTNLILKDKVFALVGALGTATHSKAYTAAALAKNNVPDLFINTGFSGFANKTKYPTTFMVLPTYNMEAKVMAKVIKDNFPGQATFMLAQDDEFGADGVAGFTTAGHKFTATPTLYPQGTMTAARAEGALTALGAVPGKPVLVLFGTTDVTATLLKAAEKLELTKKFTFLAGSVGADANTLLALGVKPTTIDGVISASFLPDAKDLTDPYVKQFIDINTRYNKGITFDNYVLAGMNSAMLTVQALRAAGKNLTRAGLMSAIEAKGSTFASAGLVPLGYSATSRVGYNGYWVSQLNAQGEGKPYGGKLVIYTTDSGAGAVEISTFVRPTMPKNGIPTNS
ncbi:MAG: branched-chain amino acid ABC transporter substrate-binding protein [Actinobacteria bacterium]|nr:branched-chain amino acid ABC transporter substrate-binding protein [Actinomycetota bacterium]